MFGIYGGTFDPVHNGHLQTALDVKQALQLDHIRLLPCGVPPHREQPQASAHHRLEMLKCAASEDDNFLVDDRELQRSGPSYMVDTLQSFHEEGLRIHCLIIGMDAFLGLESWSRWQQIFELTQLVVMHRPDSPVQDLNDRPVLKREFEQRRVAAEQLSATSAGGICVVEVTQLAISATDIRQRIRAGKSVRYLLPEAVRAYIEQQKLYR